MVLWSVVAAKTLASIRLSLGRLDGLSEYSNQRDLEKTESLCTAHSMVHQSARRADWWHCGPRGQVSELVGTFGDAFREFVVQVARQSSIDSQVLGEFPHHELVELA